MSYNEKMTQRELNRLARAEAFGWKVRYYIRFFRRLFTGRVR